MQQLTERENKMRLDNFYTKRVMQPQMKSGPHRSHMPIQNAGRTSVPRSFSVTDTKHPPPSQREQHSPQQHLPKQTGRGLVQAGVLLPRHLPDLPAPPPTHAHLHTSQLCLGQCPKATDLRNTKVGNQETTQEN